MTVKELKEQLEKVPDNLEVCCSISNWNCDFGWEDIVRGIITSAEVSNSTDEYLDERYLEKKNSDVLIIRGCSFECLSNREIEGLD